ncbi:MAG TPA: hypothetical protein VGB64_03735 [Actinomycetota bacterium]
MTNNIGELGARYRQLALGWDAAREDPEEANRLLREQHALYKQMRESTAGRAAISALLTDEAAAVRLSAATHSLAWDHERAEKVLEDLQQESSLLAVDAKWTLRSFRIGKLDLDW